REIDGRTTYLGGDLGQGPSPRQIARQYELDPVRQPLPSNTGARRVRGAWAQRPLHQGQGQALRLQSLRDVVTKAVSQQRRERLVPRVNREALQRKRQLPVLSQESGWRQLKQLRFMDRQRQTDISAGTG